MPTHNLFKGGEAPAAYTGSGLPSTMPASLAGYTPAAHKAPNSFTTSWSLAPARDTRSGPIPGKQGFIDQAEYFAANPLSVGDDIIAVLIPPNSVIDHIWYASEQQVNGLIFAAFAVEMGQAPVPLEAGIDLNLAPFSQLDSVIPTLAPNAPGRWFGRDGGYIMFNAASVPGGLDMGCVRFGVGVAITMFNKGDVLLTAEGCA